MSTTDELRLYEDGTALLKINQLEVTLREPLIKEWRGFIKDFTEAERRVILATAQLTEILGEDEQAELNLEGHSDTRGPAFATVLCRIISTLGGKSMEPGDLPAWCATSEVIVALERHWTHIPLAIGSQPTKRIPLGQMMKELGAEQQNVQSLLDQLSAAGSDSTPS